MGLCLSCRCGEAQHKAAVVAVSISHHSAASPARLSRTVSDPSTATTHPSLKRFLHVYNEGSDLQSRKVFSGSRPSQEDSQQLVIPHSSELFSLPSEGSEDESDHSRSPSPARASSTSSRPSVSLGGHRPVGRFSTDKPPIPPRGSTARTPARKSCSSLGQVVPGHKSLVETIARLEKFCDVKLFLESRTGSSLVTRNSNSRHEFSTSSDHDSTTSILLQESCRDLAHKLLCFANEHADGFLSRCDTDMKLEPELEIAACVSSDSCAVHENEAVQAVKQTVSVAKVDEPVGEATVMSRLPSMRFHDADENIQFTEFEATFELLPSETSASHRSDEASRASISAENSAPRLGLCQPAHRRSSTSSDLAGVLHVKGSQQKGPKNPVFRSALTDISPNVTPADEPLGRKNHQSLKSQTSTGVLKRSSSLSLDLQNCSLSQLEFDILLKSERWQLPQGAAETLCRQESRRIEAEVSQRIEAEETQSIEAEESQRIGAEEFQSIEAEETQSIEAEDPQRIGAEESQSIEAEETQSIEAEETQSIEAEDPQIIGAEELQSIRAEESQRIEVADSATIQQLASEGEDNAPSPSADSTPSHSQPMKGRVSLDGEEVERIQESVCTENAKGGDEMPNISFDNDIISDKSFALAFDNLFKLLQSPPGELAQNTSQLLQLLGAKTDTAELSADGAHVSDVVQTATESPADRPLLSYEAESWHHVPASLSTTEQPELPALHSTTVELECLPEALPETLPGALSVALLTDPTSNTAL